MQKSLQQGKRNKLLFYISIMIFPVVQFMLFYVYVNANSFMLTFKSYNINSAGLMEEKFVGLANLFTAYKELFTKEIFISCFKNSLMFYGVSIAGGTICSLGFSYYIYKKGLLGGFYKVMLYMPHILSTLVIAIIYKYFCDYGFDWAKSLFGTDNVQFTTNELGFVVAFNFVMSFGSHMLIYTGTMVGISDGIIEAAQIDGANSLQEFFYVIMPSIFNTFALFIITGMITIFNGQAGLFNFYGMEAPIRMYTFGYYLFEATSSAGTQYQLFPPIAALGLALTSFAIPIIFTCRHLLSKYGPKDE